MRQQNTPPHLSDMENACRIIQVVLIMALYVMSFIQKERHMYSYHHVELVEN